MSNTLPPEPPIYPPGPTRVTTLPSNIADHLTTTAAAVVNIVAHIAQSKTRVPATPMANSSTA